jgi:nucleoside 2-deoxyribosyltransferase
MKQIYIASSLLNHKRVSRIRDTFKDKYHITLTYDWTPHAEDVLAGKGATDEKVLRQIAYNEFNAVIHAQAVLVIMPGRTGTHFEYGMAYALQKPIVYLDDREDVEPSKRRFEPIHYLGNVYYTGNEGTAVSQIIDIVHQNNMHPIEQITKGYIKCSQESRDI